MPFTGAASFGFSFSCEDTGAFNRPTGRLRIQLSYTDHGTSPRFDPFTVHGTSDELDPALESAVCIGQDPPPGGDELIFLGRYRPTSSSNDFPASCTADDATTAVCRFEVVVRDQDRSLTPSPGDFFSITLSNVTDVSEPCTAAGGASTCFITAFTEPQVLYARAGVLSNGNLTVE